MQVEGKEVLMVMPCATDNLANVYVCGKLYTSKPPSRVVLEGSRLCLD